MTDLTGKRAIVSGASMGIGRGVAVELAKAGAQVVINYRSHPDEADQVVAECEAAGSRAFKVRADFAVQAEIEKLVDESADLMGGVDILVSNAVYSDRHLFLEADLAEFRKTIDVSMWGAFHFLRSGCQKMVDAGQGGNVVVISSPHAHMAMPGSMAYNMAKAANDQMARTAACELSRDRIRVNIIHPGWTDTPGERKFFTEETLRREGGKLPFGRLGRIDEIGRGVVFLCDPGSEYITGSTITIDGGIQLPWREMYRVEEKV
ncbi:MAG: SDR family oxidoreductase [Planctomycetota bacterium]|nr:SDR family oxidoreductase [Planctomycetota bacterium]